MLGGVYDPASGAKAGSLAGRATNSLITVNEKTFKKTKQKNNKNKRKKRKEKKRNKRNKRKGKGMIWIAFFKVGKKLKRKKKNESKVRAYIKKG